MAAPKKVTSAKVPAPKKVTSAKVPAPKKVPGSIDERPDFIYFKTYIPELGMYEVRLSHKDEIVLSEKDEYISGDNNLELAVKMATLYALENELNFNY